MVLKEEKIKNSILKNKIISHNQSKSLYIQKTTLNLRKNQ